MDRIKEDLKPATISSLFAIGAYRLIWGQDLMSPVPFFNYALPGFATIGLTIFSSHLLGNILKDYIVPLIPENAYISQESSLIKPAISGTATYFLFNGLAVDPGIMNSVGLGAGSVFLGDYVNNHFM